MQCNSRSLIGGMRIALNIHCTRLCLERLPWTSTSLTTQSSSGRVSASVIVSLHTANITWTFLEKRKYIGHFLLWITIFYWRQLNKFLNKIAFQSKAELADHPRAEKNGYTDMRFAPVTFIDPMTLLYEHWPRFFEDVPAYKQWSF